MEMNVAIGQMDIELGNKKRNIEKAEELVHRAAKMNAGIICLPEMFTTGFAKGNMARLAEPAPGETTKKLQELAAENKMFISGSILEKENSNIYNTAIFVTPEGLVGKHRKVHLFLEEADHVKGGNGYSVFDTDAGRIGLLTCYDAIFPEASRLLSLQGAQIILLPSNWMNPFMGQWRLATSARALDNQVWLVAANRIGSDENYTYFGNSRIVNPYGTPVVECGESEEVAVAEIDLGKSSEFKKIVDFLKDRKPKTYQALAL